MQESLYCKIMEPTKEERNVQYNKNNDCSSQVHEVSNINTALNDDCLENIFSYLPIIDKFRIERVCKRWQAVARDSWKNFKILDESDELWGFKITDNDISCNQRTAILRNVLRQCGPYLTEITFTDMKIKYYIMIEVGRICKNLKELNLTFLLVSKRDLLAISHALARLHDLESLELSYAVDEDVDDYNNIKVLPKKLIYLTIEDFDYIDYNALHTLTCLEVLNMNLTSINDECLIKVAKNCKKLRIVFLEECINISNKGIAALSELPDLKYLTLESLNITSVSLTHMPKLEFLSLRKCKKLREQGVCSLLESCDNLQELDVSNCRKMNGTKLVQAAVKATKGRTNGVTLKLVMNAVPVSLDKIPKIPPLLQVDTSGLPGDSSDEDSEIEVLSSRLFGMLHRATQH